MTMTNIAEIKAQLSAYLERVERGETIVICRRNEPIAELRPVRTTPRSRSIGPAGSLDVPESFNDPLPADLVAAFAGRAPATEAEVAAEPRPMYAPSSRKRRRS